MKIFFDENFPPQIANALNILQAPRISENIEVVNISQEFGRGVADETWIPAIGKINGVVVTQDYKIHITRQQRELYNQFNLGVFFLKPPSKTGYKYWEIVKRIFNSWQDIKEISRTTKRPFALVMRPRSSSFISI